MFSSNNLGETIRSDLLKFGVLNTFYNLNLSCKSLENEEPTVGGVPILDERNTNVGIKKKSERIPLQWWLQFSRHKRIILRFILLQKYVVELKKFFSWVNNNWDFFIVRIGLRSLFSQILKGPPFARINPVLELSGYGKQMSRNVETKSFAEEVLPQKTGGKWIVS